MPFDPNHANLAIWQRNEKTDPEFTKPITGKAFRGTSLNGTYVVKRLTQAFGPVGWGWGYDASFDDVHFQNGDALNFCQIRFWYFPFGRKEDGTGARAEFSQVGGTELAGTRKDGRSFADDEARKKSLTDALLKAASHIGIGGDIHLGRFDDSKYVESLRAETAQVQAANDSAAAATDAARTGDLGRALIEELAKAATPAEVQKLRADALALRPGLKKHGMLDLEKQIGEAITAALARVKKDAA